MADVCRALPVLLGNAGICRFCRVVLSICYHRTFTTGRTATFHNGVVTLCVVIHFHFDKSKRGISHRTQFRHLAGRSVTHYGFDNLESSLGREGFQHIIPSHIEHKSIFFHTYRLIFCNLIHCKDTIWLTPPRNKITKCAKYFYNPIAKF